MNLNLGITAVLMGLYAALAIDCALEKRWPTCLYWIGATVLTTGVIWMDSRMEITK